MHQFTKVTIRNISSFKKSHRVHSLFQKLIEKEQSSSRFQRLLNAAEEILDNKTLRGVDWLTSEFSDLAIHIRNVKETRHPVGGVARSIVYNDTLSWGLIVMLFSKTTENQMNQFSKCKIDEIWQSQYSVAKVTQMLYMTIRVHKSVRNTAFDNRNYGDKVAILCGDYFLGKCLSELAELRDHDLVELMASALRDLVIDQCLGPRDKNNRPYPIKPNAIQEDVSLLDNFSCEPIQISNILGNSKAEWTLRCTLGISGLLGKACSSVLKLAGYSQQYQNIGYSFGKYFGLTYQAFNDIKSICSKTDNFTLTSLPVLLHLSNDPELYETIEKYRANIQTINYNLIRKKVLSGNAIGKADELKKQYANAACNILDIFNGSNARNVLKDMVKCIELESLSLEI